MRRIIAAAVVAACGLGLAVPPARAADDKDVQAVLDKAMQALGGKDKLSKIHAATWKGSGVITLGGNDNKFSNGATFQGLNHFRSEFQADFMGNEVKGV